MTIVRSRRTSQSGIESPFCRHGATARASSLGMWLFLGTEIMFFGGMFCAYLIYRLWYYPEFAAASSSLDVTFGTVNTAVLICSSLTVVLAVRAAQIGNGGLQVISWRLPWCWVWRFLGSKASSGPANLKSTTSPAPRFTLKEQFPIIRPAGGSAARADFLFPLFRDDWNARAAHDYRFRNLQLFAVSGMEGPIHAGVSHASRKLRLVLALCGHYLDLSVSVVVFDRSQKVNLGYRYV